MRKKDKKEVIEFLYKKINEIDIDFHNDYTFLDTSYMKKGIIKSIELIKNMETED